MTTLETTHPAEDILREIDKDIVVADASGMLGYADVSYEAPELPAGRNYLPLLCLNTPEEIRQAKLRIAQTVSFVREAGVEAYFARVTSSTHP